jgi:hypothetical protein
MTGVITMLGSYILRIFINRTGNMADVGLYNAGFTLIETYVGMIFTAMGTDYYPRLATVANNNQLCKQNINQQAEIAILILAPILLIFLIFVNWAVILLYSTKFLAITGMIYWATLGMFFKAVSWAIAFVFLAKGASKLFFWNELISDLYTLGFNLLGYHLGGLTGLGISFLITFIFYLIQVYIIAKVKYAFSFSHSFQKIFIIQFLLALLCFTAVRFLNQPYIYFVGLFFIGISVWYSFRELESRIGVKEIIGNILQKRKNEK